MFVSLETEGLRVRTCGCERGVCPTCNPRAEGFGHSTAMAVATQALREARADHGLAEARLRTSYLELRDVCAHERVAEYRRGWEPWRICEDCGVEEHHEGTGFHVLTTDRFRRIGLGELCQLRPEVVDSLVRWCYGNRSHPPHAVFQDMEYGRMDGRPDGKPTRCCAEHALHHA